MPLQEPVPETSPKQEIELNSAPARDDPARVPTEQEPKSRIRIAAQVGAGPGLRITPFTAAVFDGAIDVLGPRWRAGVGGSYWLPREGAIGSQTARYQLGAARLRGCWVPKVAAFEFPLCAAIEAGAMVARGLTDFSTTRRATYIWWAARLGPAVHWIASPRWSLRLAVDAVLPLVRPHFGTDTTRDLYIVPQIGFLPLLGIETRFW